MVAAKLPRCEKWYHYLRLKSDLNMAYAYTMYGAYLLVQVCICVWAFGVGGLCGWVSVHSVCVQGEDEWRFRQR